MKMPFEPQDNLNLGEIGHCLFSRFMTKIHFLSPRLILMGGGGGCCVLRNTQQSSFQESQEKKNLVLIVEWFPLSYNLRSFFILTFSFDIIS